MQNNRGSWKSSAGFILAAAGSAIGVGNLWRFPYMMGENGGFWFLIIYLIIIVVLGMPVMLGELAIGRHTHLSPVAAYSKIQKGSGFVGILAILAPFLIMTYYGIVGGWALKYMFSFITTGEGTDFIALISGHLGLGAWQPVLWNLLFMVICWAVCIFGVKGIEKAGKFLMPALLVLLILVIIRSVTLPGAGAGFRFMFANTAGFSFKAIPAALGQVFFSMSLAMGAMITYGSYLKKDENLPKNTAIVAGLDTGAALLAGFAIFPAVFAMGGNPGAGAGLAFITLPDVFARMPLGSLFGALFFLLIFFAALTSAISLVEACAAFTIDTWKWKRKPSVTLLCVLFCILAIPNSMSMSEGTIFTGDNFLGTGMPIFDAVDFFANNILLPIGGLLMCIVVGWCWKPQNAIAEIEITPGYKFKLKVVWSWLIKILAPILILFVLISQFVEW